MTPDLFAGLTLPASPHPLCPGAVVLRGYAQAHDTALAAALSAIEAQAPFRHMQTAGGFQMSVAMTNCGAYGWVSDAQGYRYATHDPESNFPWPSMPPEFLTLAEGAATAAGFNGFIPDACLINRYAPGTKLSLHQDKDERDFTAPIVSVSLGVPAVFLFGGRRRQDTCQRVPLTHGDIVVWGGPARRFYHGVLTVKEDTHPFAGSARINLTFRKAR